MHRQQRQLDWTVFFKTGPRGSPAQRVAWGKGGAADYSRRKSSRHKRLLFLSRTELAPTWCGRRDSNPHTGWQRNLNPSSLPIPPRPRIQFSIPASSRNYDSTGGGLCQGRDRRPFSGPRRRAGKGVTGGHTALRRGPFLPAGAADPRRRRSQSRPGPGGWRSGSSSPGR